MGRYTMKKITDMLTDRGEESNVEDKLIDARFLMRMLSERIHSGQTEVKDVREVRKKVNSLLKDISAMIKK
jgi:hypothetical protein